MLPSRMAGMMRAFHSIQMSWTGLREKTPPILFGLASMAVLLAVAQGTGHLNFGPTTTPALRVLATMGLSAGIFIAIAAPTTSFSWAQGATTTYAPARLQTPSIAGSKVVAVRWAQPFLGTGFSAHPRAMGIIRHPALVHLLVKIQRRRILERKVVLVPAGEAGWARGTTPRSIA